MAKTECREAATPSKRMPVIPLCQRRFSRRPPRLLADAAIHEISQSPISSASSSDALGPVAKTLPYVANTHVNQTSIMTRYGNMLGNVKLFLSGSGGRKSRTSMVGATRATILVTRALPMVCEFSGLAGRFETDAIPILYRFYRWFRGIPIDGQMEPSEAWNTGAAVAQSARQVNGADTGPAGRGSFRGRLP